MKLFFLLAFIGTLCSSSLLAQELRQYQVTFIDKSGSTYSLEHPSKFLSPRACDRRKRQGIRITDKDLPVSANYVQQLRGAGVRVKQTSRWLNSALVVCEATDIPQLRQLACVEDITYLGKHFIKNNIPTLKKPKRVRHSGVQQATLPDYYGFVAPQINMLHGEFLHERGYKGENMLIAVMDGGFTNMYKMPYFASLHERKGVVATVDLVDGDSEVSESSTHGSKVLSVMAAQAPGQMVGTAPAANYVCLKTEDVRGEYRSEEFYWIVGLEYADSLGVDVVNSSLGYSTFTDASMDYTYKDMNGKHALASRYSDYAAEVGMIVVNAAGNSGDTEWKYVDTPADGRYVLSVGAVDIHNERATFSSYGPTADGRIKPDVVALGRRIGVASVFTPQVNASNGTSYAAPLITGLVAALWQAFPHKTNFEIVDAVRQSGSQSEHPDNELGYGLPDFKKAFELLSSPGRNN
ncbi:MAG: S8 family serine peptidase [Bacteroidota bacterium]